MIAKIKSLVSTLGAFWVFVAYIALTIAVLAVFFLALKFLAAIANLLAAISLLFLVPLLLIALLFKRKRRLCGRWIIIISYLWGFSTWLTATVWLNDLWGAKAVIIGVLMFGIGSVPLGCLALLLHGKFAMLFTLLGQLAALYILRMLGVWIEEFTGPSERTAVQTISDGTGR
jgi:type IV secretory pathway VirB6-like protein